MFAREKSVFKTGEICATSLEKKQIVTALSKMKSHHMIASLPGITPAIAWLQKCIHHDNLQEIINIVLMTGKMATSKESEMEV